MTLPDNSGINHFSKYDNELKGIKIFKIDGVPDFRTRLLASVQLYGIPVLPYRSNLREPGISQPTLFRPQFAYGSTASVTASRLPAFSQGQPRFPVVQEQLNLQYPTVFPIPGPRPSGARFGGVPSQPPSISINQLQAGQQIRAESLANSSPRRSASVNPTVRSNVLHEFVRLQTPSTRNPRN